MGSCIGEKSHENNLLPHACELEGHGEKERFENPFFLMVRITTDSNTQREQYKSRTIDELLNMYVYVQMSRLRIVTDMITGTGLLWTNNLQQFWYDEEMYPLWLKDSFELSRDGRIPFHSIPFRNADRLPNQRCFR